MRCVFFRKPNTLEGQLLRLKQPTFVSRLIHFPHLVCHCSRVFGCFSSFGGKDPLLGFLLLLFCIMLPSFSSLLVCCKLQLILDKLSMEIELFKYVLESFVEWLPE